MPTRNMNSYVYGYGANKIRVIQLTCCARAETIFWIKLSLKYGDLQIDKNPLCDRVRRGLETGFYRETDICQHCKSTWSLSLDLLKSLFKLGGPNAVREYLIKLKYYDLSGSWEW